jgi:excisionase family DNA binding protein
MNAIGANMVKTPDLPPGIERRGISVAAACEVLGLSRPSIYRLIKRGKLPHPRKVGGIGSRLDYAAVQRLADETWGAK